MRDYTRFFTPYHVAKRMVEIAMLEPRSFVLEPHCGAGNIIHAINDLHPKVTVHACEIDPLHASFAKARFKIDLMMVGDFLCLPMHAGSYDRIIANPPFNDDTNLQLHFIKMMTLLSPAGFLVTILPATFVPEANIIQAWNLNNWAVNRDGSTTDLMLYKLMHK